MFAFVLGIIFSNPGDWHILVYTFLRPIYDTKVYVSFGFVVAASLCYGRFAMNDRPSDRYNLL
jgi:hypothetical protein